jgi:6-phosphogluconolactonase
MKLQIFDTRGDLFQAAAQEFATRAENSVKDHGRFCVALSGGSTPKGLFTQLATGGAFPNIPWDKVFLFWGDERHVPPDHADSNYRMTKESLLSKVPIPSANVFRIKAETEDAGAAAGEYEQTLKICFGLRSGELPRFDLVLQGMGSEGHTASLFPGSPALEEQGRLVVAPWVEKFNTYRISLTFPVFDNAACVLFLVAGKDKAPALKDVFENPGNLPASRIRPTHGELLWFVDRDAASALENAA